MAISGMLGTLSNIPVDVVLLCLRKLSPADLKAASLACRRFRFFAQDSGLWVHLCQRDFCLNPPKSSARKMYRVCSDMKWGRYAFKTLSIKDVPIALIGQEISLENCFYDANNENVKNLSCSDMSAKPMTGIWKGQRLATIEKRASKSIHLWEEKEMGCLDSYDKLNARPKEHFIRYQWHGKDLVTVAGDISSTTNPAFLQIWDVNRIPKCREIFALPYDISHFISEELNYGVYAWDGEYLAVAGKEDLYVGRMNEHSIEAIAQYGIKMDCCVTSLKWHGKFLFVGDGSGEVMIYDREAEVTHRIDLSLPEETLETDENDWYFFDFLFHGNLVFITTNVKLYSELALWQQNENGSLQRLYSLANYAFKETDSKTQIECVVKDNAVIAVKNDVINKMEFGASYEKIFRDIAESLKKSVEMKNTKPTQGQDTTQRAYQRLSNMPRSQVALIEQEINFIAEKNGNDPSRKDEYTYQGILKFLTSTEPPPSKKGRIWYLKS